MSSPTRFAWRTLFARSRSAVFVVGGDRRLRFANAAWEEATGQSFATVRGSKLTSLRRSRSPFAPPPEVWAGQLARVRRAAPGHTDGPPWWDFTFLPLLGDGENRVLAVVGVLTVVGVAPNLPRVKVPESLAAVRAAHAEFYNFDRLAGPSPTSERLLSQVRAAAIGEMPVWITGEPGTGKETVARVIHHNGPRRERAFVGLVCGGLQPYLIDGLLFGKGGAAGGRVVGTLYLKNPHLLPAATQEKILNWCDSASGPRLICGATSTAGELVKTGHLARLFHTRYAAFDIAVPPLRTRLDDLPKLSARAGLPRPAADVLAMLRTYSWPGNLRELTAVFAKADGGPLTKDHLPRPAADVLAMLRTYTWPGNLRELADVLAKADGGPLTKDHLPRVIRERHLIATHPHTAPPPMPKLDDLLMAVEKRLIENALAEAGGNQGVAAERLGVFRQRLARRMAALGIAGESE